jgi:hypothetical protein
MQALREIRQSSQESVAKMSDLHVSSLVQQSEALAAGRGVQPLSLTVTGRKITLYAAPKPEERDIAYSHTCGFTVCA